MGCRFARYLWLLAFGVVLFELLHQSRQAAVQGCGNPDDTDEIGSRPTGLNHGNVGASDVGRQGQRLLRHPDGDPQGRDGLPKRRSDFGIGRLRS